MIDYWAGMMADPKVVYLVDRKVDQKSANQIGLFGLISGLATG